MRTPEIEKDLPSDNQVTERKLTIKWYPYFLVNGNLREKVAKGSFEITDCPMQEDVEMAINESNLHPAGRYKVEKRESGKPIHKESFYCVKPEASFFRQNTSSQINEVEQTEDNFEDDFENDFNKSVFDINEEIQARAEIIALRREIQEMKRDRAESSQGSQNETLSMIREVQRQSEKSFQQGLQFAQMMLQSQANQPPQVNPANLMLEMLQSTLAVQKGVKELSEEISPPARAESGNFLDGAANLIDSISRNVPKILPVVAGLGGLKPSAVLPLAASPQRPMTAANGNGANASTSNLSEMFDKIKKPEKEEK